MERTDESVSGSGLKPGTTGPGADKLGAAETHVVARKKRIAGLAGAAGLIAMLTVLARAVGFGRIIVFSSAIGFTNLGDVYQTVNTLPNIVFEIVAGGALAAVVVPLISAALGRQDRPEVNQLSSALLGWALVILTPLAIALAVFARPLAELLLGADRPEAQLAAGARMLAIFAPQLVLYGVGVVFTGILQAHHRFAGPALAPLLSSITVIGAYVLFGVVAGRGTDLSEVSRREELILSVGTTAAVAVLTLSLLIPLRRAGVVVRPTLRFPAGAVSKVRALLLSGMATVGAQWLTQAVILRVLQPGPEGTIVAFQLVQIIYLLPWGVLAVPVATSAFPRLSAAHGAQDYETYRRTLRVTARVTVVLTATAAAILIAAARPIAEVLMAPAQGRTDVSEVAAGIVAFAPGLVGYGLLALLTRALYATGASFSTAVVTVVGWATVITATIIVVPMVDSQERVAAVGAANSIGMTVVGIALAILVARRAGAAALTGLIRTTLAALVAAGIGSVAGWAAVSALPAAGGGGAVGSGVIAMLVVVGCVAIVMVMLDRGGVAPVIDKFKRVTAPVTGGQRRG